MSAGAPVLASDLDAFGLVLEGGTVGRMFPTGDAHALAKDAIELLGDEVERDRLSKAASLAVRRYDWSVVAKDLLAVYEMVTTDPTSAVRPAAVEVLSGDELLGS
jgi:phosphatidylinositol alpha-mannosyltransferase